MTEKTPPCTSEDWPVGLLPDPVNPGEWVVNTSPHSPQGKRNPFHVKSLKELEEELRVWRREQEIAGWSMGL